MFQIPTLYTNYQELLLDIDIYGNIVSSPILSKDELKSLLFEEYKITHPLPTLEDKRYELSRLVSSDYHISYSNELDLASNEILLDLGVAHDSSDNFDFDDNVIVPSIFKEKFEYGSVTDRVREELIRNFINDTEELSDEDSKSVENLYETVKEDNSLIYEDSDEIDYDCSDSSSAFDDCNLDLFISSKNYEYELDSDKDDDYSSCDVDKDTEDVDSDTEDDDYSDDDYSDTEDDDYSDDDYSDTEDDDYSDAEDDDYSDVEDDESDEDDDYSGDNYSDEDDEDDYSDTEDEDSYEDDEDDYSDTEDEDDDYSDDDYSDTEYEDENNDYSDTEDDGYSDDDLDTEDEDDYSGDDYSDTENDNYSDDEYEDEDDYSDTEDDDNSYSDDEDEDNYSEDNENDDYLDNESIENEVSDLDIGTSVIDDKNKNIKGVDSSIKDNIDLSVPTPIEIINSNKEKENVSSNNLVVDKPKINRDEEPKDLRDFVRKHPRCEVSFALNYFSRKEIEKYIMMGKVIKKGSKLHI